MRGRVYRSNHPRGIRSRPSLGINVLASVEVDDTWILYRGIRTKEDYFHLEKRISWVQSLTDKTRDIAELVAYEELLGELRRLHGKLTRRLHLYRNFASHLIKTLHAQCVHDLLGLPVQRRSKQGQQVHCELVLLPQVDGRHRTEGPGTRH